MNEVEKSSPTRRRILEAVIACIEKEGINNLTTRSIAAEAGVNIAAINYYFRTKDALVEEALTMSINHMLEDITAILGDQNQPFNTRLEEAFFYLVDGAYAFPGTFMAHLYSPVVERRYDTVGAQAMLKVFRMLIDHAIQAFPQQDAADVKLAIYQIVGSVLFTMLSPGFLQELLLFQLTEQSDRRQYAHYLAHAVIHQLQGQG